MQGIATLLIIGQIAAPDRVDGGVLGLYASVKVDESVKSLKTRHPGEGRGPENLKNTGSRPSLR